MFSDYLAHFLHPGVQQGRDFANSVDLPLKDPAPQFLHPSNSESSLKVHFHSHALSFATTVKVLPQKPYITTVIIQLSVTQSDGQRPLIQRQRILCVSGIGNARAEFSQRVAQSLARRQI